MLIGVVGLGYVGLPLAVAFAEAGHDVAGVDVDPERVARLADGVSDIEDIISERIERILPLFRPTTDFGELAEADAILICVPTPLAPDSEMEPDLSFIDSAAERIAPVLSKGQLVVLESTTYPGTTRERLAPVLESGSGLVAGIDFNLAFSPERIDPGRTDHDVRTTPKVVGGLTTDCSRRAAGVYEEICDEVVVVSTPEAAELAKLLENIFRSVNIAMVNELAILADRMGIDIWEVIDAASTKPFGFMRFEPGPGMGGHCLPIDPFYLTYKAKEFDFRTEFIELAGRINRAQPEYCVSRIERLLGEQGLSVDGARVLILGVSYKAGVGDLRESPGVKIAKLLAGRGAIVSYHDPHVPRVDEMGLESRPLEEALDDCDLACVVTAHQEIDFDSVFRLAPEVLDLRGITRGSDRPNVTRL